LEAPLAPRAGGFNFHWRLPYVHFPLCISINTTRLISKYPIVARNPDVEARLLVSDCHISCTHSKRARNLKRKKRQQADSLVLSELWADPIIRLSLKRRSHSGLLAIVHLSEHPHGAHDSQQISESSSRQVKQVACMLRMPSRKLKKGYKYKKVHRICAG
jgi:hypothetical protein